MRNPVLEHEIVHALVPGAEFDLETDTTVGRFRPRRVTVDEDMHACPNCRTPVRLVHGLTTHCTGCPAQLTVYGAAISVRVRRSALVDHGAGT